MTLIDLITKGEGLRLKLYMDCCSRPWRECVCVKKGKLSGGIGRNFDDVGLSVEEALFLLNNDIAKATRQADAAFPWFKDLNEPRQWVVISMIFNMGIMRFLEFRGMIAAIQKQDWEKAAAEMLDSKWAFQVGDGPGCKMDRAEQLAQMMREGRA